MLTNIKKVAAIAGLSGILFVTTIFQADAATKTVTVQKGDTLWGIARVHDIAVSKLKNWNQLSSDIIDPGLTLSVSGAETEHKKSSKSINNSSANQKAEKKLTVKATAYTATCAGCSGITTKGLNLITHPQAKVIAVDPNVIPLGSKVHVQGMGNFIASDTGGAIKGNHIDVFVPSEQKALDFGVKHLKVTILKK